MSTATVADFDAAELLGRLNVAISRISSDSRRLGPGDAFAAYPGARAQPHKYEDGHYLVALPGAPADTTHRIVFETAGGVVTRFRGGVAPAVEYVEGCS